MRCRRRLVPPSPTRGWILTAASARSSPTPVAGVASFRMRRTTSKAPPNRCRKAGRLLVVTLPCHSKASPFTSMRSTFRAGGCSKNWRPHCWPACRASSNPRRSPASLRRRCSVPSSRRTFSPRARCSSSAAAPAISWITLWSKTPSRSPGPRSPGRCSRRARRLCNTRCASTWRRTRSTVPSLAPMQRRARKNSISSSRKSYAR